jgi:hypothetical protein
MAMSKRPGGRADATGRSEGGGKHVRLYEWMLASPAYRDLRPTARALLVELARIYNGRNNGKIALAERDGADLLGMADKAAIRRAFRELTDHGFITMTKKGGFNVKDRSAKRATEWRLEWQPVSILGQAEQEASKAFMRWKPRE